MALKDIIEHINQGEYYELKKEVYERLDEKSLNLLKEKMKDTGSEYALGTKEWGFIDEIKSEIRDKISESFTKNDIGKEIDLDELKDVLSEHYDENLVEMSIQDAIEEGCFELNEMEMADIEEPEVLKQFFKKVEQIRNSVPDARGNVTKPERDLEGVMKVVHQLNIDPEKAIKKLYDPKHVDAMLKIYKDNLDSYEMIGEALATRTAGGKSRAQRKRENRRRAKIRKGVLKPNIKRSRLAKKASRKASVKLARIKGAKKARRTRKRLGQTRR